MEVDDVDGSDMPLNSKITSPGESLTSSQAFMRGHGTYVDDDEVIASVAGTVERVNKLITVRPLQTRYNPEVGDLVVGRITEVAARRWKVDANSRQDAVLMLSSVNLPGGVQVSPGMSKTLISLCPVLNSGTPAQRRSRC